MRRLCCIILPLILYLRPAATQSLPINRQSFFLDEKVLEVTLTTDIKKLRTEKAVPAWQPANVTIQFSDTLISEEVRVQPRGISRKENCDIAALMLNFKNVKSPALSPLKKLKLVGACGKSERDEDLVIKEYLVYKIYNLISGMSFRVRLLRINYKDSKDRTRPFSQYAFLIEDIKDLAKRNNCVEKKKAIGLDDANRQQFNFVCLFQYMVGNTDWSVRQYHNIKLMVPKTDTLARPYVVPYDFDYAGIVDAPYAAPNDGLGILSVTQRLYRGFARSMDELAMNLEVFKAKEDTIMFYIANFPLLSETIKKNMIRYLEGFYKIIGNDNSVRSVFIKGARTD